jgi:hypothetical protein
LSPIPNWLHKFYTDFSLTFPNYDITQPLNLQKQPKHNNLKIENPKVTQKDKVQKQNLPPTIEKPKITQKEVVQHQTLQETKQKAINFIINYIPNKSPFISGDLVNSKMQLCKNGTLISYFTRYSLSIPSPLPPLHLPPFFSLTSLLDFLQSYVLLSRLSPLVPARHNKNTNQSLFLPLPLPLAFPPPLLSLVCLCCGITLLSQKASLRIS